MRNYYGRSITKNLTGPNNGFRQVLRDGSRGNFIGGTELAATTNLRMIGAHTSSFVVLCMLTESVMCAARALITVANIVLQAVTTETRAIDNWCRG